MNEQSDTTAQPESNPSLADLLDKLPEIRALFAANMAWADITAYRTPVEAMLTLLALVDLLIEERATVVPYGQTAEAHRYAMRDEGDRETADAEDDRDH